MEKEKGAVIMAATKKAIKKTSPKKKAPTTKRAIKKASPKKKATTIKKAIKKTYKGSICSDKNLPEDFADIATELEKELSMPVWFLVQNTQSPDWQQINVNIWHGFFNHKKDFNKNEPIALVIDSPGGSPRDAYKIARFLRYQAGGYTVIVPGYAKSAATLLSLGADKIIMGAHAELGPLDMQIPDRDKEASISALNEFQSLERLNAFALQAFDTAMQVLLLRTEKKVGELVPLAMKFSTDLVRPLMENIEPTRYTEVSRLLKIGEAYAIRLLKTVYGDDAQSIASTLVENYPEHGFVIDAKEAKEIKLNIEAADGNLEKLIDRLCPYMDKLTVIGKVKT